MKIALINGSPKVKNSASECVLKSLKTLLPTEYEMEEYLFNTPKSSNQYLEQIAESDVLIFAFPLYVDGIPSHLIHCLSELEQFLKNRSLKSNMVYTIVNCGFYEGEQSTLALDMMKNWCDKTGLTWGQGIGLGGGGMLQSLANVPDGQGPKKNFSVAVKNLADNIAAGITKENQFVSPNFPRLAYKLAAEMGWRQQIKANGLKHQDLFTKR